jgi:hypothetical protein
MRQNEKYVNVTASSTGRFDWNWIWRRIIFIVAPSILKSKTRHSPTNALFIKLGRFQLYTRIHINFAPTCFALRPSSGSLYWSWVKLCLNIYVLIGYVLVWQHVLGVACVLCAVQNGTEWRVCCVLCRMSLIFSCLTVIWLCKKYCSY